MRGERQLDWEMLTGRAYRACQWIVFALILLVLARTQVHAADVSHIDAEAAPIASSAPITSGEDRVKVKAEVFIHIAGAVKKLSPRMVSRFTTRIWLCMPISCSILPRESRLV